MAPFLSLSSFPTAFMFHGFLNETRFQADLNSSFDVRSNY